MKKIILSLIFLVGLSNICLADSLYPSISFANNSSQWSKRNLHLIPDKNELKAIMKLDQDGDGFINIDDADMDDDGRTNLTDKDIDGDGIVNQFDPSPYDKREKGYNPFGVLAFLSWRHGWNNFKYDETQLKRAVKLLKSAGVSMVRMDFYWNDIEPEKGKFDFKKYDFIVELLSKNNIDILAILDYSADWAAGIWNSPPDNDQDFINYSQEVVYRYKDKIKYWELWNEPDCEFYWKPQDGMKRYARLLKGVYAALKKIDPSCKVVMGGLTQSGYYALKNLYREGAKDHFDIVNFHPFVDPFTPDHISQIKKYYNNLKKLMKKYNDGHKKIWFTEIGSPGMKEPRSESAWWCGRNPTESVQAKFAYDVYDKTIGIEDVEKIFWAFFRDCKDHFRTGVDHFGLIRWDFSKKPSFNAYRKVYLKWKKNWLKKSHRMR